MAKVLSSYMVHSLHVLIFAMSITQFNSGQQANFGPSVVHLCENNSALKFPFQVTILSLKKSYIGLLTFKALKSLQNKKFCHLRS